MPEAFVFSRPRSLKAYIPFVASCGMRRCGTLALASMLGCSGTLELPSDTSAESNPGPVATGDGSSGGGPSGGGAGSGGGGSGGACTEAPSPAPLVRLSRRDYVAALERVVGPEVVAELDDLVLALPVDASDDEVGFDRQDQRVSDRHVEQWYRIAERAASLVASSSSLRREVLGDCAASDVDESCLRQVLPGFLETALRRPPQPADIDAVIDAAADFQGEDQVEAAVFMTLMAPDFLFRFENRGVIGDDGLELTDHELATRLSFHFWNAPPDSELLRAAAAGELSTEAGYRAQVDRIFADPRSRQTLLGFFAEWLHLDRGGFATGPRLEALADGIDTRGLAGAMRAEVLALLDWHLSQPEATWRDVLTSQSSFATDPRLADIYGAPVWDETSAPPALPPGERSGVLTRAGMLYTADGSTNPFRRGAFLARNVLCGTVPAPPTDLPPDALEPPGIEPGTSTRDAFAALVTPDRCANCHALFSDFGYGLEAYDGLGRYRTEERLVTTEGVEEGTVPVDDEVVPRVGSGDQTTVGPVELMELIAASPQSHHCLAERYLQFNLRRELRPTDRCWVERAAADLDAGLSLSEAMKNIAFDPAFRVRARPE